MKVIFHLFAYLFFISNICGQSFNKREDYYLHNFFQRIKYCHLLDNYDDYVIKNIDIRSLDFISTISKKSSKLNEIEKIILQELLNDRREFDKELISFSPDSIFNFKFFNSNPSFLFYSKDTSNNFVGVNFLIRSRNILDFNSKTKKAELYFLQWGGKLQLRYKAFCGYIQAFNGKTFGFWQKKLWKEFPELHKNVKLQDFMSSGEQYIDDTEGNFSLNFEDFEFGISREKIQLGYGELKELMNVNIPRYDFVYFNYYGGFFNYSFIHSKLLGTQSGYRDSLAGDIIKYEDKYLAFHRFNFNFSKYLSFGFSETAIYSRRGIDLSYLNPFNFYKSVEHSNQDRDNALMQFDINSNPIKGVRLFFSLIIDDINFSKLNTGWHGNALAYNFGANYFGASSKFLYEAYFQTYLINPYVFSHRIKDNSFSHLEIPTIYPLTSNSANFLLGGKIIFDLDNIVDIKFLYNIIGKNKLNNNGEVVENYGSDINLGYRLIDKENIKFLEGEKEKIATIQADYFYRIANNLDFNFIIQYINYMSKVEKKNQTFSVFCLFNYKI